MCVQLLDLVDAWQENENRVSLRQSGRVCLLFSLFFVNVVAVVVVGFVYIYLVESDNNFCAKADHRLSDSRLRRKYFWYLQKQVISKQNIRC